MQKVIVQVPIDKKLRDRATRVAEEYGLSSLQEAFRIFATKLARKHVSISLEENVEYLTPQEDAALEQKYKDFLKEERKGKTFVAHSVEEMIKQLTS